MEASKETGCQVPEGPILCVNNCGFFGSATTMNMCSKCHKETILKQEQAKFAASSIESIVNGGTSINPKDPVVLKAVNVLAVPESPVGQSLKIKPKDGPSRCASCRKRVGLTGFHCRCGHLYCGIHRYSDKHDCQFDYQAAARNEIAKANPVVKAEKLGKI